MTLAVVCVWCTPHHTITPGTLPASHGMCRAAELRVHADLDRFEQQETITRDTQSDDITRKADGPAGSVRPEGTPARDSGHGRGRHDGPHDGHRARNLDLGRMGGSAPREVRQAAPLKNGRPDRLAAFAITGFVFHSDRGRDWPLLPSPPRANVGRSTDKPRASGRPFVGSWFDRLVCRVVGHKSKGSLYGFGDGRLFTWCPRCGGPTPGWTVEKGPETKNGRRG